jgi:hypothetical protein
MRRTNGFVKEPCLRPAEGRYPPTAVLQALPSNFFYSPKLVEEEFSELRHDGVLRSSHTSDSPKFAPRILHHPSGG